MLNNVMVEGAKLIKSNNIVVHGYLRNSTKNRLIATGGFLLRRNNNEKGVEMLTPKQEQFCIEYIKDYNGTRAAVAAGYSPNGANRQAEKIMRKTEVRERINELNQQVNVAPCIASAEEIRSFYSETMRDVNERTENRIKAADSLAKTYALFTDKVQMSGQVGVTIIDDIPKEDE